MSEQDKLKYWLDGEIAFIHALLALIFMWFSSVGVLTIIVGVYAGYKIIYSTVRFIHVSRADSNFLSLNK